MLARRNLACPMLLHNLLQTSVAGVRVGRVLTSSGMMAGRVIQDVLLPGHHGHQHDALGRAGVACR